MRCKRLFRVWVFTALFILMPQTIQLSRAKQHKSVSRIMLWKSVANHSKYWLQTCLCVMLEKVRVLRAIKADRKVGAEQAQLIPFLGKAVLTEFQQRHLGGDGMSHHLEKKSVPG